MPFNESGSVTLDGNGDGTIRLGQVPNFRRRSYISVSVSISTGESSIGGQALFYRGDPYPSNFVTGTVTPWQDTSSLAPDAITLMAGEQATILFDACDPGAIATVLATYVEKRPGESVAV